MVDEYLLIGTPLCTMFGATHPQSSVYSPGGVLRLSSRYNLLKPNARADDCRLAPASLRLMASAIRQTRGGPCAALRCAGWVSAYQFQSGASWRKLVVQSAPLNITPLKIAFPLLTSIIVSAMIPASVSNSTSTAPCCQCCPRLCPGTRWSV